MFTPDQCRMARAALKLEVRDLAEVADVSPNTIARLERGEAMHPRTLKYVRGALEAAGIRFITDQSASPSGGPGVRFGPPAGSGFSGLFDALTRLPSRRKQPVEAYEGLLDLMERYMGIIESEQREPDTWERIDLNRLLSALDRSDLYSAYHSFMHAITPPDNQSPDYPIPAAAEAEVKDLDLAYFKRCTRHLRSRGYSPRIG